MPPDDFIPYTVIFREEAEDLLPGTMTFVPIVRVTYRGPDGVTGRVDVHAEAYGPQAVDAAIQAKLHAHVAVGQLGSAPVIPLPQGA
jgi:hypothetical protein